MGITGNTTVAILAKAHRWNIPTVCPVCGTPTEINAKHTRLYCPNEFCPEKSTGTVLKWCDVHGIKELGRTTLEKIQERGYFLTVSGLYLDPAKPGCDSEMTELLGKNWSNIVSEIEAHRSTTVAKFVAGYNIPGIGEKLVQKALKTRRIESLSQLFGETDPDRFVCEGIGQVTSRKFSEGLEKNRSDMEKAAAALTVTGERRTEGSLDGKSFCFTGAMEYKRKDLQEMVTRNGGTNSDNVTRDLDYLVMQDPDSMSGKAKKARTLGIKLISPEEFLKMCEK